MKLVEVYPDDRSTHALLVDSELKRKELDRARAVLDGALEREDWSTRDRFELRWRRARLEYDALQFRDFVRRVDAWVAEAPEYFESSVLEYYVAALIFLGRSDEADERLDEWLKNEIPAENRRHGENALAASQFRAAFQHVTGSAKDFRTRYVETRWMPRIVELCRASLESEDTEWLANRAFSRRDFAGSPATATLIGNLDDRFASEISTLPLSRVRYFLWLLKRFDKRDDEDEQRPIAEALLQRLAETSSKREEHELFDIVSSLSALDVRRKAFELRVEKASNDSERAARRGALFFFLLGSEWSAENARQALSLLPKLGHGEEKAGEQASAVGRLTVYLSQSRYEVEREAIEDRETKTSRALRSEEEALLRTARSETVETLRKLEGAGLESAVLPRIRIERLTLEVRVASDKDRVSRELRELFAELPPKSDDRFELVRQEVARRAIVSAAFLAAQASKPTLGNELVKLLSTLPKYDETTSRVDGRSELRDLLIALDRGDQLETSLAEWASDEGRFTGRRWRAFLGRVLAERGDLPGAVDLYQKIESEDELLAGDYTSLASWLQALGREDAYHAAVQNSLDAVAEGSLSSQLRRESNGHADAGFIDETVVLRFAALLRKASNPADHLWILRNYFKATKDFRLLRVLAEGLLGLESSRSFRYLHSSVDVLLAVDTEAALDELVKAIEEVRGRAQTAQERLACDALEWVTAARAADQSRGGTPHEERAFARFESLMSMEIASTEQADFVGLLASTAGRLVPSLEGRVLARLAKSVELPIADPDLRSLYVR
ncbi:MAG: hypothetical protein AAF517_22895, partial [Planctomycetota bacterium]